MKTSLVKSISLRANYEGNLNGLAEDIRKVKSLRRNQEKQKIRIPIGLDLSGIHSDARKAAGILKREISSAMGSITPGSGTSKGGLILPASAMHDLAKASRAAGKEVKRVTDIASDGSTKAVTSYKQLERGIQQVDKTFKRKGKTITESRIIDTKPVEKFRAAMDQLNRDFAGKLGTAQGSKGDVAKILRDQRSALEKEIAAFGDLAGTPDMQRANKALDTLEKQINRATGQQDQRTAKATTASRTKSLQQAMDSIDKGFATRLGDTKGNQGDVAKVLDDKRLAIANALASYGDIANSPAFRSAQKAITTLDKQIAQAVPTQNRATRRIDQTRNKEAAQRMIKREDRVLQSRLKGNLGEEATATTIGNRVAREHELNRVLDERAKLLDNQAKRYETLATNARAAGKEQAAEKFTDAGRRVRNDLNQHILERARGNAAATVEAENRALSRRYEELQRNHALERERLNTAERLAQATKSKASRGAQLKDVLDRRATLQSTTGAELLNLRQEAQDRGNHPLLKKIEGSIGTHARQGERDLNRLTTATKASGHAFDFHTTSLLKNAATFTRWYVPAQATMALFNAIGTGLRDAVAAQRTFAVLNAVFRGSREDAARLADETLRLAAANGRSAQEAAQASVSWARSGLTRIQILSAVDTSLRAANVAEISAADATEYLSAAYKGLGLSIADLNPLLDYLNSLSNQYGVTVESLFQGISRTGSVAKQAGLSYQQLAATIATVSDLTKRPGAEIGNSIKSTLNRIARPEIQEKMKLEFGVDALDATGALKPSFEILKQLAALYPTLNTAEQARLTNLVAGSLQSNRFTVILENFTDVLIAQAKAGADANSSQRENAEILSTLDAQLQAVNTSWTALLHTLGESGAFDAARDSIQVLIEALRQFQSESDKARGKSGIRLGDLSQRQEFATLANTSGSQLFPNETASREELQGAVRNISSIQTLREMARRTGVNPDDPRAFLRPELRKGMGIEYSPDQEALYNAYIDLINRGRMSEDVVKRNIRFAQGDGRRFQFFGGRQFQKGSREEVDAYLAATADKYRTLLGEDALTTSKDLVSGLASKVSQRQTAATSLAAGADAFTALARDAKVTDRGKLLKQFESLSGSLTSLPGGFANVAEADLKLRPLIETGDLDAAVEEFARLSDAMRNAAKTELVGAETDRAAAIEKTTAALAESRKAADELNLKLSDPTTKGQEELRKELDKTNATIKDQAEALRGLQRATELPTTDPLQGERGLNLDRYFADLKVASEAYDQFLTGIANTGLPDLDAKLRIGAGRMQFYGLRETYMQGKAAFDARRPELETGIRVNETYARMTSSPEAARTYEARARALRDELAMHEAIATKLETQAGELKEQLALSERKLELERQAATLNQAFTLGGEVAAAGATRFGIGLSEGERLLNTQRGLMNSVNGWGVAGSSHDPLLGAGDAAQDARQAGALTANLTAAKQGLINIETRYNTALAERANLELTITEEARKQREERSKTLALASREDQLRSAAASAILRSRGQNQFSLQEFQFFSEGTRNAINSHAPDSVKGLDDSERENNRRRSQLDGEITLLATSIRSAREAFENASPYAQQRAAGLLDPKNLFPDGGARPPAAVANGLQPPQVNLNLGTVDMRFELDRHIPSIIRVLQGHIDSSLQSMFQRLDRSTGPNTTPAAGTF